MLSSMQIGPIICFSIGWPLNLLLIWLIIYKTDKAMRIWSWLLLQTALFDLGNLMTFFIVQPVLFFNGAIGAVGFYSEGPFGGSGSSAEMALLLMSCLIYFSELSKYAIAGQFFYRWMIICRDRSPSPSIYAIAIGFPAMIALFPAFGAFISRDFSAPQQTTSPECPKCPSERRVLYFKPIDSFEFVLNNKIYLVCNLADNVVILVTALLIWCKSQQAILPGQQHSREFSRQIGLVLFFQAMIPFVLSLLPSILISIFTASGINIPEIVSIITVQPSHSVLAPVSIILIVGQYRRFFVKLLCRRNATASTISANAIQVVQCPTMNSTH